MRAYVQQLQKGDLSYLSFEQTAYWFEERDYEVIRFDYPQLEDRFLDRGLLKFPHETIVSGGVRTIRTALQRAGRHPVAMPSLPDCLDAWIERKYWTSTFGNIQKAFASDTATQRMHIKPLTHDKLFTGRIVQRSSDLARLGDVAESEPVLVQEPVEFVSEWRAYVLRKKILHVGHYLGEPLLFPDATRVRDALHAYEASPIGFSMDWGVTADGRTLLVEVNDGSSLGNYGLSGKAHTAIIEARWREMMGLPDNGVGG